MKGNVVRVVIANRLTAMVTSCLEPDGSAGIRRRQGYAGQARSPSLGIMKGILVLVLMLAFEVGSFAQTSPTIIRQPANQTVPIGAKAGFSVAVSGTGPLTYQWQFNGTNLPNHTITTVAGNGAPASSGDGGPAINAGVGASGLAVDGSGNVFIAESSRIRRVDTNGIITTVAGNGVLGYSGDGGPAANAELNHPSGKMALDASGNLFFADVANQRVRKVGTNGVISTVAGNGLTGYYGNGGKAISAALGQLAGVTMDGSGNLFIADAADQSIRKVDTNGVITTVAGNGVRGYSGDGRGATAAELASPAGVTVDGLGNLFIADSANQRIRKVDANRVITTVAGNGLPGYSGDGGVATFARLYNPLDAALDGSGNLFIADSGNQRIRKVDAAGIMTTVAGTGTPGYSGDGGSAASAQLSQPSAVVMDSFGTLFIVDQGNNRVRKVTVAGPTLAFDNAGLNNAGNYDVIVTSPFGSVTSSVAALVTGFAPLITSEPASQAVLYGTNTSLSVSVTGTKPLGYQWFLGGAALAGQTNSALDLTGVGFADTNGYAVVVSSPFGSATSGVARLTLVFAPPAKRTVLAGASTSFSAPVPGAGPFNFQWQFNGTNLPAIITTAAGSESEGYSGDGLAATNASLSYPGAVAVDGTGNLFIADSGNNRVRRVDTNGVITTLAGNGTSGHNGDGVPAINASLSDPAAVAVDANGSVFIGSYFNPRVRKVGTNGIITTVAGNGRYGYSGDGGAATNAELAYPSGVAVDGIGNLYIADNYNERVRKVGTNGIITTIAGTGAYGFSGDGGPAIKARLAYPSTVAVDAAGNVFIADANNHRVRRIDRHGIITTVAGNGAGSYSGDGGAATNASLYNPRGVAVDGFGNVFITDSNNERVRQVGNNGVITTVAGNGTEGFSGDGGAATNASLFFPSGVTVDAFGSMFIADSYNSHIRKVTGYGPTLVLENAGLNNAGSYDLVVTSPSGSVTNHVALLTVLLPPGTFRAAIANDSNLRLDLTAAAGRTYVLEAAESLVAPVNWQPVFTNAADAAGNWSFTNSSFAAQQAAFFRVIAP